jgi:hypothetical protein
MRRRFYSIKKKSKYSMIYYTTSDQSIVIPNGAAYFGATILSNNYVDGVGIITFDNEISTIGDRGFYGCSSLTSVTIPDSVTTIGSWAFYGCSSLTSVYCKAITPPAGGYYMFDWNASGRKIYVPTESVDAYKSAAYWSNYADAIVEYDF